MDATLAVGPRVVTQAQPRGGGGARGTVGRAVCSQTGDHFTLVHIWNAFEASGFSAAWARDNYLHFRALKMARNIYQQLEELMGKLVRAPRAR